MTEVEPSLAVDWAAAYAYLQEQQESILLRVAERMEAMEAELAALRRGRIRSVELRALESGELRSVIAADGATLAFAFYVYRDDVVVRRQLFDSSNTLQWKPERAGAYRVRALVRLHGTTEPADSAVSTTVAVTAAGR